MGLGSSYVSIAQGASALLWNPAGLGYMANSEIGLHHDSGLDNSMKELLVFGMNFGEPGGFAAAVNYSDNGSFETRDGSGELTGIDTAGGFGAGIGWGKIVYPGISAGAAIKIYRQNLLTREYTVFAGDLGLLWNAAPPLNLGLTYSNIGSSFGQGLIASGLRAGASYSIVLSGTNTLLAAISTEIQPAGLSRVNFGVEGNVLGILALRAGYVINLPGQDLAGITGITAGIGVKIQDVTMDYAYVPFGGLGTNHRISFTYSIPPLNPELKPAAKPVVEEPKK